MLLRSMALNPSLGVALYTDGSSYNKDRSGGWAYVAVDGFGNEEIASGSESGTTNNRMEMHAVVAGLINLANDYGRIDVLVCSDSEYVIKGAEDPSRARNKNRDLWQLIDSSIRLHNSIEFQYVKGHDGDYYNEIADKLAGMARKGLL